MKTRIARPDKWKQSVSIRLDPELAKVMEKQALKEKITLSALARRIIDEHFSRSNRGGARP
jgi:hypothetical protein